MVLSLRVEHPLNVKILPILQYSPNRQQQHQSVIKMRFRQFLALSSLMLAGNLALAAELDRDDVPDMCRTVCEPVVSAAARCDRDNDNDTSEMNCICNSDQADTRVPQCEACIAQYRSDHPRDDDYDGSDEEDGDEDDDDADPHDNGIPSYHFLPPNLLSICVLRY
jgi:hypothetical protein